MDIRDRYIRFDWAIKRLLRQKANFGVLEGFLTVFLGEKVEIVDILESESNQQEADDKFNRVDIKARNSKGEIIIVEVQNTMEVFYLERILYGVAKAITEHINLGDTYEEVKKVYSISILYFDIGQGEDYIYKGQNHFVGLHTNDELKITTRERDTLVRKAPEDVFPTYYLIRVKNFDKVAVSPMEEWMRYLKEGVIGDDPKAPGLKEAKAKLQYYLMDKKERYAYDEHINAVMIQNDVIGNAKREGLAEGRAEGRAEGLAQGKAEGLAQGKAEGLAQGKAEGLAQGKAEGIAEERSANLKRQLNFARAMLADGMDVDRVMQYTGLTKEQIDDMIGSSID